MEPERVETQCGQLIKTQNCPNKHTICPVLLLLIDVFVPDIFQLNSVLEHNSLPQFASPLGSEQTNTYAATRQTEVTAESPVSLVLADLHKMPTNRQKRMAPVQGHANYRVAIIFLSVLNRGLSSAAQPSLQRNACVHS